MSNKPLLKLDIDRKALDTLIESISTMKEPPTWHTDPLLPHTGYYVEVFWTPPKDQNTEK